MSIRSSGILLHPTSLPSPYGIGDLGPSARRFSDFLMKTGQRFWQVLPMNPTRGFDGHSPYHSPSAFAGNPLLISPEALAEQGLLPKTPPAPGAAEDQKTIDFSRVEETKMPLLRQACDRFGTEGDRSDFNRWCGSTPWLDDYALYTALRSHYHPHPWYEWPAALRDRDPSAIETAQKTFKDRIQSEKILQYLFFRQWFALKHDCNLRQIRLIGDMPIYVPLDSADVWVHPGCFKLAEAGRPTVVSGVPPDYFSETGQLWGHPVYDWEALKENGYGWWVDRMRHHISLYDITRIDHFRGLVACWEVPAGAKTAVDGEWVSVPAEDFFDHLIKCLGRLPVIAEDLGTITADVREIIRHYGFPGMRVLLFAFGDDFPHGAFLPHRHEPNCVVYTGTHDNNTIRGWFGEEADAGMKKNLFRYLGREVPADRLHWAIIRLAMMSPAETVIVPLQDVLGLDSEARMNLPGRARGNWLWRFEKGALDAATAHRLKDVTETYGRQ